MIEAGKVLGEDVAEYEELYTKIVAAFRTAIQSTRHRRNVFWLPISTLQKTAGLPLISLRL